jgi:hypothetical protein
MNVKILMVLNDFAEAAIHAEQGKYEQLKVMFLSMEKGTCLEWFIKTAFTIAERYRPRMLCCNKKSEVPT